MEILFKQTILRDNGDIEFEEIINFKEFLIVFYGAAWLPKSKQVSNAINEFLEVANPDPDMAT